MIYFFATVIAITFFLISFSFGQFLNQKKIKLTCGKEKNTSVNVGICSCGHD